MNASSAWPPALRRKLGIPPPPSSTKDEDAKDASLLPFTYAAATKTHNPTAPPQLTSHELRNYIHSSYAALTSIQRQLHRGEESYFEETYAHGNLFAGWDNIWIENPNSSSSGVLHHHHHNTNESLLSSSGGINNNTGLLNQPVMKHFPARKMPNDFRWFSSSCGLLATGGGKIAELDRPSLIDRPPTPEIERNDDDNDNKEVGVESEIKSASFSEETESGDAKLTTEDMDVDDSNAQQQEEKVEKDNDVSPPSKETSQQEDSSEQPDTIQKKVDKDDAIDEATVKASTAITANHKEGEGVDLLPESSKENDNTAEEDKDAADSRETGPNTDAKDESTKDAEDEVQEREEGENSNVETTEEVEDQDVFGSSGEVKEEDAKMTLLEEAENKTGGETDDVDMKVVGEAVQSPPKISDPIEEEIQSPNPDTEASEHETKSDADTQLLSSTDETQKPAKVPKLSVNDTPNRTSRVAVTDDTTENETPVAKSTNKGESTVVEGTEAAAVDTMAKPEFELEKEEATAEEAVEKNEKKAAKVQPTRRGGRRATKKSANDDETTATENTEDKDVKPQPKAKARRRPAKRATKSEVATASETVEKVAAAADKEEEKVTKATKPKAKTRKSPAKKNAKIEETATVESADATEKDEAEDNASPTRRTTRRTRKRKAT